MKTLITVCILAFTSPAFAQNVAPDIATVSMALPAAAKQDTSHKHKPKNTVNKQWHSKHKDTTKRKSLLPPKH